MSSSSFRVCEVLISCQRGWFAMQIKKWKFSSSVCSHKDTAIPYSGLSIQLQRKYSYTCLSILRSRTWIHYLSFPLGLRKMILPLVFSIIKCLLSESLLDWKRFIDAHNWDVKEQHVALWWSGTWMSKYLTITCPHQVQYPSHWRHRCCCLLGLLRESQLDAIRQSIKTRTRRSRPPYFWPRMIHWPDLLAPLPFTILTYKVSVIT